jgi:hypothetical protein
MAADSVEGQGTKHQWVRRCHGRGIASHRVVLCPMVGSLGGAFEGKWKETAVVHLAAVSQKLRGN